jgi:hypothetical protein
MIEADTEERREISATTPQLISTGKTIPTKDGPQENMEESAKPFPR